MPCDQINVFQANLDHLTNWDRLEEVAKSLGYRVYRKDDMMTMYDGRVSVELNKGKPAKVIGSNITEKDVADIKSQLTRGYTKASVAAAAKRWGWQAEEKGQNKLVLKRRF